MFYNNLRLIAVLAMATLQDFHMKESRVSYTFFTKLIFSIVDASLRKNNMAGPNEI